ncbi:hypothetical protein [Eubacterium ventriosum]|uniref:hypothetical protein n=1 Tax=Eubacterium ventriosum TaxID=39496 RepID=UPI00399C4411
MGTDSLYYIRDYSGNYYRINNVNELVAVRNETDATVFNYDQAKSHIGTGKKSAFYRAIPIETEDGNDGGNIAFNSVEVREEPDMENQYENISAVKELTYEEMMIEERKDTPFDGKKNDISEQSEDVVSQVMAGRSDEKQMENVEGMVS